MANPQATVRITGWLTANVPILCGPRPLSWEGPKDGGATSILIPQDGRELGGHRVSDGHFQGGSRLCSIDLTFTCVLQRSLMIQWNKRCCTANPYWGFHLRMLEVVCSMNPFKGPLSIVTGVNCLCLILKSLIIMFFMYLTQSVHFLWFLTWSYFYP